MRKSMERCPRPKGTARPTLTLGEGWVGQEALTIGLYSALVAKSFREVFSIAANHDGDSDSTAAIAGQFYGVRYVWISLTWRIRSVSALE